MQSDAERKNLRRGIQEAAVRQDAACAVECARRLMADSAKPADAMFCATAFASIGDALREQLGARRLKTFIVRSVTVEPILPSLSVEAVLANYALEIQVGGYGSHADELLNKDSSLAKFEPDLVLILLDLEEIAGQLPDLCADGVGAGVEKEIDECVARMGQLLRSYRAGSSARILFQGIVVPEFTSLGDVGEANLAHSLTHAIERLNQGLAGLCGTIADCVFFDVDRLAARHGREKWRDARMFYASRLAVSAEFFWDYSRSGTFVFDHVPSAAQGVMHGPG